MDRTFNHARKRSLMLVLGIAATGALALGLASAGRSAPSAARVHFGTPLYVDQDLAGGEPTVMADPAHGTIVYTAHEGTTHLYRNGLVTSPWGDFDFVLNYCNQVNTWWSDDGGVNWYRDRYLGSQCPTPPTINTGFSDPDLTIDQGGRMYNTGIDLVNDSVFSSNDGGKTWDRGTPQCHDGDRPWLAGGHTDEVYMATDPAETEAFHVVYHSEDGGQTCSSDGIPDDGTLDGHGYNGFGKLYFDMQRERLAEPEVFDNGVGVGTWKRGDAEFTPHFVAQTSLFAHWPAIAVDRGNDIYLVWDTEARQSGTAGGCNGAETPAPNKVKLAYSTDFGRTWSEPITIASPDSSRVFWPWVTAGTKGRVSVVWFQTGRGQLADLDCQAADVYVYETTIVNATRPATRVLYGPNNASGRPVHQDNVCQGGTTCVATGQDRRLGDYFTNAFDAKGCVLIATSDTMLKDPSTGMDYPTARPLFIRQKSGPSLIAGTTCRS